MCNPARTTSSITSRGSVQNGNATGRYLAAALAIRLDHKIGGESIRYIAKKAGLSPQTVLNILNGKTWPDLRTIAKLEIALNTRLWGNEHRKNLPLAPMTLLV